MSGANVDLVCAPSELPQQMCLAISQLPGNLVQSCFIAGLQGGLHIVGLEKLTDL